jgi:hypothetical protein
MTSDDYYFSLASAPAKVWLYAVEPPRPAHISTAQAIDGAGESLKDALSRPDF